MGAADVEEGGSAGGRVKTTEEWKAYITEQARRLFPAEGYATASERGRHAGGSNDAVPWPADQPTWLSFDIVHNMYVFVYVDRSFDRIGFLLNDACVDVIAFECFMRMSDPPAKTDP